MKQLITFIIALLFFWNKIATAQDFTIGVIPDWQKLTYMGTDGAQMMQGICQWFANHKKELNLVFVASLGDMSQGNFSDTTYSNDQWKRNVDALSILRANKIPFSPNQGNHDPYVAINKYFPVSYFEKENYWGGSMNGKIENAYYLFKAGGMKFIVLNTQWEKSSKVNAWANRIFKKFNNHRAIYITHSGVSKVVKNDGYLMDSIVRKNDNIFLATMGHLCETDGEEYWTTTSEGGKTQHLLRTDYQCRFVDKIPGAMFRYYTFKPKENRVYTYTYNLRTQSYETDENSQFSFYYPMSPKKLKPLKKKK